jgi:hypothetical protein
MCSPVDDIRLSCANAGYPPGEMMQAIFREKEERQCESFLFDVGDCRGSSPQLPTAWGWPR